MRIINLIIIILIMNTIFISAETVEEIYVVVDEDIITRIDYELERDFYVKEMERMGQPVDRKIRYSIITNMINNSIIRQEAERMGVTVTDNDVNARIHQVMKMNNIENKDQFKMLVEQQGLDWNYFLNKQKQQIYSESLIGRGLITILEPTFAEVKDFYKENKKDFKIDTPKIRVSQILIRKIDGMSFKEIMEKKDKANKIKKELEDGLVFAEAVAKYSEDEMSINEGGDLGYIVPGVLSQPIITEISVLDEGEISDILSSQEGYHIFKITEKLDKGYETLEMAAPQIKNYLFRQKQEEAFNEYIKEVWDKTFIDFKKDPKDI